MYKNLGKDLMGCGIVILAAAIFLGFLLGALIF